jgi:hypothetical protein
MWGLHCVRGIVSQKVAGRIPSDVAGVGLSGIVNQFANASADAMPATEKSGLPNELHAGSRPHRVRERFR